MIAVAYGPVYSPAAFSLYAQPAIFGGMIYGAAEASARTLVGLYGELQFHNAGETSMEIVLASAVAGTFYWSIELLPD